MTLARTAQKRDANESTIVNFLMQHGCSVDVLPGGEGRMDLLVGDGGEDIKMEVKMPGKTLNPKQKKYHSDWKGAPIHVVFTPDQALYIVTELRKRRRGKA